MDSEGNWCCKKTKATSQENKRTKACYRLFFGVEETVSLLQQLMPFLIVKKRQALWAIKFQKKRKFNSGNKGVPELEKQRHSKYFAKFKLLNKRGGS